jgi:hypothetical protein
LKNRRNYYRILHVQPDAPDDMIRASYRTLMKQLRMHPDLGGDHWNAAVINEAFETLSDPVKRAAYDRTLKGFREGRGQNPPPTTTEGSAAPNSEPDPSAARICNCPFCGAPYGTGIADSPDAICNLCQSPLFPATRHEGLTATRRTLARLPRSMLVTCCEASQPAVTFELITEDISLNGMRVTSPSQLSAGQRLRIEFSFGVAVGVVTHVTAEPDGWRTRWRAGVQFLTMRATEVRGVFLSVEG